VSQKEVRMETHYRSVLKAFSYRLTGTLVTILSAWLITGYSSAALKIGLLDILVKTFVFYCHERFWNRVPIGKMKSPEYQI